MAVEKVGSELPTFDKKIKIMKNYRIITRTSVLRI
jgi:hypothetical protein